MTAAVCWPRAGSNPAARGKPWQRRFSGGRSDSAAEKLGTAGPFMVAPVERLTHLATDKAAAARALRPFKEGGLHVITA